MCLPSLSKTHLDGYMTRPDARSCHQTNFSKGGFVRKGLFCLFSLFQSFLFVLYLWFFKVTLANRISVFKGSLASCALIKLNMREGDVILC